MRIDARIGLFVAVSLLALLPLVHPAADPAPESESTVSSTSEEAPSGSSSADGDKKDAEGDGKTSPLDPFVPTESIPADSAVSFPVDI